MKKTLLLNYLKAATSRNPRKNTTRFNGLLTLFVMVMGMGVSMGQTAFTATLGSFDNPTKAYSLSFDPITPVYASSLTTFGVSGLTSETTVSSAYANYTGWDNQTRYFYFTITAQTGYNLTITEINSNLRSSNTGPKNIAVETATSLAGTWTTQVTSNLSGTTASNVNKTGLNISLSSGSTLYIRYRNSSSTSANGNTVAGAGTGRINSGSIVGTYTSESSTVTFDASSGSITTSTQTAATATNLTSAASLGLSRSGYFFGGWASSAANATAGTVAYADGASYPFTSSTTLYAIWKIPTWNGTAWSNTSGPTSTLNAVIAGDLTTSADLICKDLTINSGNTLTIGAANSLTVAGNLVNDGNLIFKSDINGTARFASYSGAAIASTNVTVERYVPAKRAWRALTAPVSTTTSIFANWQENGANSGAGNGLNGFDIWMPAGSNGLTAGGSSNSLLEYNSANNSWTGINSTNGSNSMMNNTKNKPFMAFVTGPYGSGNITSNSAVTTIRATGSLFTGNQTYSSGAGEYTFIGNPYASPLNLKAMLDDSANNAFDNTIWIWQAIGAGNVGVYNTFDPAGIGTYTNVTNPNGIDATTQIQSGQAFFVKSTAAGTFTIKESHKGNTNSAANIVFRDAAPAQLLRVGLYKQENNEWSGRDGAMTVILPDANANQSPNKMANGTENVAFVKNGSLFASEHHLPLVASDVLNIRVWRTTAGANYKLKINTEAFTATNLSATLEDLFTNSRTPLNLEGTAVEYPFTVTTDALSTGDRFRIVFQNAVLGTNNPTATSFSIVPNPVTGDSFQVNLGTLATGIYSYSICNAIGQEVEKGILNNATQNTNYEVKMNNSATGIYIMKIKGNDNSVFTTKLIKK
jgi:hypothetical protein